MEKGQIPSLVDIYQQDILPNSAQGWSTKWASDYPPYNSTARCVKCRCGIVATKYQKQIIPDEENKIVMLTERQERTCERCGYMWYEAVREIG